MKNKSFLILLSGCLSLLPCLSVHAQISMPKAEVSVSAGITRENFNWSIAGNLKGENPNVLSELIWKNLSGPNLNGVMNLKIWRNLYYHFDFSNTFIKSGSAKDTDYGEDQRRAPSYSADVNSNQGKISFIRTGIGYQFLNRNNYTLKGFAGYTWNKQSLYLLPKEKNTQPNIKTLNSTYKTTWKGAFIGVEGSKIINNFLTIGLNSSYEQLNYEATADWNLIDAFAHPKSFIHRAKGYGLSNKLFLSFKVHDFIALKLQGNHYYAVTADGIDELFLVDGGSALTRMNEASRQNIGLNAGISFYMK